MGLAAVQFVRQEDFGERLEQRLGDLADPDVFAANCDSRRADIVFVDAAKDGVFEYSLPSSAVRLRPTRSQLVILDDIKVVSMLNLWRACHCPSWTSPASPTGQGPG